ncbi:MAG: divalent-cation tolerance protein CutA [Pirellulaceae bacterium]|jgi:periplasmic divalent cation tolerance protein|nr:divalent-cation tolerance protein CutA [Pirellulaceae bacterium]
MRDVIQVSTTTDRREVAVAIADALLAQRLAACVAIGGPVQSVYRWQGRLETAQEWTCTAKTVRRLYAAVEACLRARHNYEEPEILVTDVTGGSRSYLDWLRAQVQEAPRAPDTQAPEAAGGTEPFPAEPGEAPETS